MKLLGFVNGMKGVANEEVCEMTEDSFKFFRNLGGYDYTGKAEDVCRTPE